jgi:hypothetical protein
MFFDSRKKRIFSIKKWKRKNESGDRNLNKKDLLRNKTYLNSKKEKERRSKKCLKRRMNLK